MLSVFEVFSLSLDVNDTDRKILAGIGPVMLIMPCSVSMLLMIFHVVLLIVFLMTAVDHCSEELVALLLLLISRYIEAVRKLKCSGVQCDRTIHLCFVPGVLCYAVFTISFS